MMRRNVLLRRLAASQFLKDPLTPTPTSTTTSSSTKTSETSSKVSAETTAEVKSKPISEVIKEQEAANEDIAYNLTKDFCFMQVKLIPYRISKLQQEIDCVRKNPMESFPPLAMWPVHIVGLYLVFFLATCLARLSFTPLVFPPTEEEERAKAEELEKERQLRKKLNEIHKERKRKTSGDE